MGLFEILDDALKDLFVITLEKEFLSQIEIKAHVWTTGQ